MLIGSDISVLPKIKPLSLNKLTLKIILTMCNRSATVSCSAEVIVITVNDINRLGFVALNGDL